MIPFRLEIDKSELTRGRLEILNGILGLTAQELEVLAFFIDYRDEHEDKYLATTPARKLCAEKHKFTNVNKYVSRLVNKGTLSRTEDGILLNPKLEYPPGSEGYVFRLNQVSATDH